MTESAKTVSFVAAAAVLILGAWLVRPQPITETQDDIGKEFFPDFKDALAASSLEIVEFDDQNGVVRPFKVAQVNGVFAIPSHENYPADAKNQLEQAALALMGLEKFQSVSDSASEHEMYGVVDPDSASGQAAGVGAGKRVTLEDKSGKKLASLIIGKKDAERPDLHYVRIPGQDRVYRASIKTDKLSTNFSNWIEQDLLKLNPFDIKEVVLDDHSVDEVRGAIIRKGIAVVDYNSKESKWNLVELKKLDPKTKKMKSVPLKEDEELDTQKLNELKNALDDLKIVDVVRKPAGISKELRASSELRGDTQGSVAALARKGFFLASNPDQADAVDLVSNEGEIRCGLTDGVEYVLRFGEIAGQGRADGEDDEKADGEKTDADANKPKGVDRYIMVTTRFREDLIPKPELTPLPDVEGSSTEKPAAEGAAPANDGAAGRTAGDEHLLALADDAVVALAQKSGTAKANAKAQPAAPKTDEKAAPPAADKSTEKAAKPADEKPAAEGDEASSPEQKPAEVDPDVAAEAAEKERIAAEAARKRIEEGNKRKEEEYQKKIEAGQKRVVELNDRFADWYFVISDATYQKIHVGLDQLIVKKTPADAAGKSAVPGLNPAQGGFPGFPGLPQVPGAPK